MLKSQSIFSNTEIKAVAEWTEKKFGKYRGHRALSNGINILSHSGGFAVFFPPKVFHPFDIQVPVDVAPNPMKECWIAGKGYGFIKVDVTPEELQDEESKKYIDKDVNKALDKIEQFVKDNFINARGLYPDSNYFTHGSFIKDPDSARPFRMRMGGNFHLNF